MTKLVYHPVVVLIISIVAAMFIISLNKTARKTEISSENIKSLENEVHQMSNELIDLENNLIETESDEYKEKIIRNELLLQKPGEKVIQMQNIENSNNFEQKSEEENKPINQWLKLLI